MTRPEKVSELVDAALNGLSSAAVGSTAAEVVSAAFTLADRSLTVALEIGVDRRQLRSVLETMLMRCADATVN